MSDLARTDLQILLNGEKHELQQDEAPRVDPTEECTPSDSLDDECASDKEVQAKMQSVLQQVRKQIRSQGGVGAPKSNILELVQKVWEKEVERTQLNGVPEVENGSVGEEKQVEMLTETQQKVEDLCAIFEEKLEASKRALRGEFEAQILQLRKEMQAYTDQALEDKIQSSNNVVTSKNEQQKHGSEKKQTSLAAPPLALRRGRVLTRTMTTIIPKTCTPVIIGPRAKSETLSSSKNRLVRDPAHTSTAANTKSYQNRRPLPPVGPRQPKRPAQAKDKTRK